MEPSSTSKSLKAGDLPNIIVVFFALFLNVFFRYVHIVFFYSAFCGYHRNRKTRRLSASRRTLGSRPSEVLPLLRLSRREAGAEQAELLVSAVETKRHEGPSGMKSNEQSDVQSSLYW